MNQLLLFRIWNLKFEVILFICYFQLASVILKQYVEAHWTVNAEKYRDPETTEAVRANFLNILLLCPTF